MGDSYLNNLYKNIMKTISLALSIIALLGGTGGSFAATITWGVNGQPGTDFDVFSDGTPISAPGFTYELGVFEDPISGAPFSPTAQNIVVWEENWVSVASSMLNPTLGAYGGSVESDVFVGIPQGSRVYIWGYNSQDLTPAPEWVLFTGTTPDASNPGVPASTDWLSPDGSQSQASVSLDFAPQTADTAIVGRIPGTGSAPGDYGGDISDPAVLGVNTIQTASVPEPTPGILLMLTGLFGMLIRRRR